MSELLWRRSDDWVGSAIEDSFVMLNIDSGKYIALNATAHAVWEALETPVDQASIEQTLCQAFEVSSEDCHRSVGALLTQMHDLQLVTPS